jgi:hypothetical protein
MADEITVDVTDPQIQDVFANDVFVDIGESEISLLFSRSFYANGVRHSKPSVRIILSHDNYMRMIAFLEKRAKLLHRAYANRTPNLYAGNPDVLREAFAELAPAVEEDVSTEENYEYEDNFSEEEN